MTEILVTTLEFGPATVLTNGTVLQDEWLERLREAADHSRYSLEFRVSIDGFTAEQNDPIRGPGTFDRAMRGVGKLVGYGFLPIITAVRTWEMADENRIIQSFVATLKHIGYTRPRLKILPTLHLGEEANRTTGYSATERVTTAMMEGYDPTRLVCHHSRIVTDRGVHVCPILVESPDSLLGDTLQSSLQPFRLAHGACTTCYRFGAICANAGGGTAGPAEKANGAES